MIKRTIIYLHSTELLQASWIVCTGEHIEHSVLRGHLSELTAADKEHEITVVVPAFDVLLTEAALPKLNRQRLLQALPFALEENLIGDLSDLHFAIGDYQPEGVIPVAVVAHKKMTEWLTLCKQYDIVPAQLYSALFTVPFAGSDWSASILQETSMVRQSQFRGFSCEADNLPVLTEIAIKSAKEKPECIHIYSTFETPVEITLDAVIINAVHLSEQVWLEKLPTWIQPQFSINLLQGQYQAKHKSSDTRKIWIYAATAVATWLLLTLFSNLISFFILHHENHKIETAIEAIYKKNFPQATAVITPRERMENKLAATDAQANKNYFLVLLAKVGEQFKQITEVHLKTLDFRDNQLNVDVTAAKFDNLDAFIRALKQQGLQVRQQNAAVAGEQIKATLIIQRGKS